MTDSIGIDASIADDSVDTGPSIRTPVIAGLAVVLVFFGVFGAWAALAPLSSGAIAPGVVIVDSQRKTIQHLEGGIVRDILVREGHRVTAGQVLIRLDDTQSRTQLSLLQGRQMAATALEARLIAERDGHETVLFPESLIEAVPQDKALSVMQGQFNIFDSRRESIMTRTAILEQRVAQLSEEIIGLEGQIKTEDRQLKLIAEELKGLTKLYEKGLALKSRLLELKRSAAVIEGSRSRNVAAIARARQSIGEARLHVDDLKTGMMNEVMQELRDTRTDLFDFSQRISAVEDVLARTEIRAPIDGTVVGLQVHSPRGVIGPGEPLLDIVPSEERLVVEARVTPTDIDIVHADLPAKVRFTAFNMRSTVPVDGIVQSVSADRLADERSGEVYFLARVEIIGEIAAALGGAQLYPGMPAEVMIVTGERTPLDYFLSPVTRSFERALREQ